MLTQTESDTMTCTTSCVLCANKLQMSHVNRKRHNDMHHQLWDGLKSLGLSSMVEKDEDRLITVNTIKVRG